MAAEMRQGTVLCLLFLSQRGQSPLTQNLLRFLDKETENRPLSPSSENML